MHPNNLRKEQCIQLIVEYECINKEATASLYGFDGIRVYRVCLRELDEVPSCIIEVVDSLFERIRTIDLNINQELTEGSKYNVYSRIDQEPVLDPLGHANATPGKSSLIQVNEECLTKSRIEVDCENKELIFADEIQEAKELFCRIKNKKSARTEGLGRP